MIADRWIKPTWMKRVTPEEAAQTHDQSMPKSIVFNRLFGIFGATGDETTRGQQ
jgi:hypothetical protein